MKTHQLTSDIPDMSSSKLFEGLATITRLGRPHTDAIIVYFSDITRNWYFMMSLEFTEVLVLFSEQGFVTIGNGETVPALITELELRPIFIPAMDVTTKAKMDALMFHETSLEGLRRN